MKFKAFLILGISSVAIGQAYLWANDSSFSEEKNKLTDRASIYFSEKKDEAVNSITTYATEKKDEAVNATKKTVKDGFDKALNGIGIGNTPEKNTDKIDIDKKSIETSETKQESPKDQKMLYEVNFKYDHQGAPDGLTERKMLSLINDASNIWERFCGVKFNMIGNIKSDYIAVDKNIRMKGDFGVIRWSDLGGDAMGQAHLGGTQGPAKGFMMDLDIPSFSSYDGSSDDIRVLKTTLIHELGHVIGLEHSRIPESIMYFAGGTQKAELNKGDIEMCQNIVSQWRNKTVKKKLKI